MVFKQVLHERPLFLYFTEQPGQVLCQAKRNRFSLFIEKDTGDFDTSEASSGIVYVNVDATDSDKILPTIMANWELRFQYPTSIKASLFFGLKDRWFHRMLKYHFFLNLYLQKHYFHNQSIKACVFTLHVPLLNVSALRPMQCKFQLNFNMR